MARPPALRIGCSGWNYKAWRGPFYPRDLPAHDWLAHYTSVFDTVELNNTFYQLPDAARFSAWRAATPPGFCIAVKASGYLTHMKRLREPREPIRRLFTRIAALGPRLGPILYQLPPHMLIDLSRLDQFLTMLPRRLRARRGATLQHVMEFRDPSWYTDETFALLDRHGVALCTHDKRGSAFDRAFIGPFVYVRFHGTSGHYRGKYRRPALARWAARLAAEWRRGRDVYAYFNNDPGAAAPENALALRALIRDITGARA